MLRLRSFATLEDDSREGHFVQMTLRNTRGNKKITVFRLEGRNFDFLTVDDILDEIRIRGGFFSVLADDLEADVGRIGGELELGASEAFTLFSVHGAPAADVAEHNNAFDRRGLDMHDTVLDVQFLYLGAHRGVEITREHGVGDRLVFEFFRADHSPCAEGIKTSVSLGSSVVVVVRTYTINSVARADDIVILASVYILGAGYR